MYGSPPAPRVTPIFLPLSFAKSPAGTPASALRPLIRYLGYNTSDTTFSTAGSITGDTLFQQTETTYDAASNVIRAPGNR